MVIVEHSEAIGCFRTRVYAEAHCRISSYLQTMAYQEHSPLVAIQAVMTCRILGSLRLGYCLAPVVVAHDPGSPDAEPPAPRRIVFAQYAPGHADLRAVRDALATPAPGRGGSSTILGSPQGGPAAWRWRR